MRWIALILFWAMMSAVCAEPDPKKYKPEVKVKDKQTNSTLTDDERIFLREVESKFGIKPIVLEESKKNDTVDNSKPITSKQPPPFPAVIAIEIVNDTDTKSKDKRTIDANLGYGYRTNNGYTYTYFGKPTQEKGKFMIYPYSQEDIPPSRLTFQNTKFSPHSASKYTTSPTVEIQPSKAFELVPVKEEQTSYHYRKPVTEFKTKYESVKGLESPPPPYMYDNSQHSAVPSSTLYTTYNGEQFSGLSGQFPMVMPNYFVNPSQLLNYPQYQSAGLTQDHLRPHGPQLEQRVVPVLVLRIPSSYLKNPTADLYANLPQNYPLSQHLNNVNLQQLVNQYLKKNGYPVAPQVMAFQKPALSAQAEAPVAAPISNYEPQQYANPYVRPSYTQADYSGVQYSAVQPVMAKYPSGYTNQQYYMSRPQPLYQQPRQQQQYEYQYQYVPQTVMQPQTYYVQQQYQQEPEALSQRAVQGQTVNDQHIDVNDAALSNEYELPQQATSQEIPEKPAAEYGTPQNNNAQYSTAQTAAPQEAVEYSSKKIVSPDYGSAKLSYSDYSSKPTTQYGLPKEGTQQEYYSVRQPVQKETIAIYPSQQSQTLQNYRINPETGARQSYLYQKQVGEDSASKTLILSENYPSKDHTLATVLPFSFKASNNQNSETVQSVDYVTPVPSSKYQSQYKVMVPQTVLKNPNEKVSYVNSHSLPMHYIQVGATNQEYNPEEEYTVATPYIAVSSQKPPSYPRNYHSHPKRMAKPDNKPESNAPPSKKHSERNELKT